MLFTLRGLVSTLGALALAVDTKLNDRCGHNQLVVLEEPRWDSQSQSNIHTNNHWENAQHRCTFCPRISHTHIYTRTHTLSLCSGPRWRFRVSTVVGDICSAFVCECHNQKAMLFISNLLNIFKKRVHFFSYVHLCRGFQHQKYHFVLHNPFFSPSSDPYTVNQLVNVWLVSMVQVS